MTELQHFSLKRFPKNIIGMKVSASNSIIGAVTNILRNSDNQIEGVEIRRDRDQTFLSIHYNRIAGIDEEHGIVVIN